MEQKDYKKIRDCFFKSYKSFVDFITITHNDYSMYSILILKKTIYNHISKISITIRNSHNSDSMFNEYSNNVILTNDEAENLINDIRNDFRDTHDISYSAVNTGTFIQTLQNTKFSLNIKLNNLKEYEEAIEFNDKINCDSKRYRVLTKK